MQNERSKMLGTMKMTSLVPKISVPIMISMLVQALYNVADSIFVARYDLNCITAVSLVFPIQMLIIAFAVGLGTGINSLISRRLGEKRNDLAREAARHGVFLELCAYLIFLCIGLFLAPAFMSMMTKDPVLQDLGVQYLQIVTVFSFGCFVSVAMERIMQSAGNSSLAMCTQLTGAIINIILDPILIFGLLGVPAMGIRGAAIATVIGQIGGMMLGIFLNQTKNKELKLSFRGFKPCRETIGRIMSVGFPSIIMQSISSVMNVLFNMILMPFGNVAVTVLGIYFKLQSFVFMPVFGLGNGLVAIVGYNFGAQLKKRVYAAIRVALTYALVIMAVGTALFIFIPGTLMSLFDSGESADLIAMGETALRIISAHFILAGIGITLSTVFQAIGKGMYSLVMSLCRQLIVLIPCAWVLSRFGVNAVWWSFLVAETISVALALVMYRKVNHTMLMPLQDPTEE
ncbi:MAG: MATE family efflux transporter [Clostridia bacterium]|nr:MATE family efflux transporter [Clostridia bacterium]